MREVSVAGCATYEQSELTVSLDAALSPLGGIAAFVRPGDRVLLKVNLLSRALPERAVTTHPELVRAMIRAVRAAGGVVTVGDSPGGPNTPTSVRRIWDDSGIGQVCADEGVELVLFDNDTVRAESTRSELFPSFTLGRIVAETDVLITMPKFKTHGLMMFTGAVKNLFGCIPGMEKAQYHLKVPDRDDFGSMLIDLMLACRPALAIMDAVVGMEGEGPAGGTPRHVGAILASADCVALDVVASAMAGLDPMEVYSNKAAARRGLGPAGIDEVSVLGEDWRALSPEGFALPERDLASLLPPWLGRQVRGWVTARPVLERPGDCTGCRKCESACPLEAIAVGDSGPRFDRDKCIRCYCCQELCPPQAIGLKTPLMARIFTGGRAR